MSSQLYPIEYLIKNANLIINPQYDIDAFREFCVLSLGVQKSFNGVAKQNFRVNLFYLQLLIIIF